MRRYAEAAGHLEAAIPLGPDAWEAYGFAATTYLAWDSSPARARAALERLPEGIDPYGYNAVLWFRVNAREGGYGETLEQLSRGSRDLIELQMELRLRGRAGCGR